MEHFRGVIERVTFHSEESGYCVLRVSSARNPDCVTVVGHASQVIPGEFIEAEGTWSQHRDHGLQFQAKELKTIPPTTAAGMERYLASGLVKGIGPAFAKRLVKAFGDKVFDVIESNPDALNKVPGFGKKRVERIKTTWHEQKAVREIMVFLHSHGVGTAYSMRIYKTYGANSIESVRENPYRLARDIDGIGFKTADRIAQNLGVPTQSLLRARAGVGYTLQQLSGEGHCAFPTSDLVERAAELLEIDVSVIQEALFHEMAEKTIVAATIRGQNCVAIASLHAAEQGAARRLMLLRGKPPWRINDISSAIDKAQQATEIQLAPSQRAALTTSLENKVSIITGGPGVGKTTIIRSFLHVLNEKKLRISLCAPTGRAARRMGESTGMSAQTIHRLLQYDPRKHAFTHDSNNPLPTDLVVVDESSMIDVPLFYNLLKAIPDNAGLVMVGDVDQLPSVGPGQVLADLINSQVFPVVRLTEIFRQAAESRIIVNAHRINCGQMPLLWKAGEPECDFYVKQTDDPEEILSTTVDMVADRLPRRYGLNAVRDIQVLSPMNRGLLGTRNLNKELQARLNPRLAEGITRFAQTFAPGDKIMAIKNDYDKEVFNGDIGFIDGIDHEEKTLCATFDDRLIEFDFGELDILTLAYAASIHKSQGSEYPTVVIPLATQHYMMLQRNLLYTGITRGKRLVVLVGQRKAIWIATQREEGSHRFSALVDLLQGAVT